MESLGLRARKFRNSRLIGSRRFFHAVTSESDFAAVLALSRARFAGCAHHAPCSTLFMILPS